MRRGEQRSRLVITATLVVLLAGCGEARERTSASASTADSPTSSTASVSVDPAFSARDTTARAVEAAVPANTSDAYVPLQPTPAIVQRESLRHDAISALELVGTSIDGANAFAVVRTPDHDLVTVREGTLIGGYTVRRIQPDRIRLQARDDKEAMLVIGASAANRQSSTSDGDKALAAAKRQRALMAAGINTDQSIPEHVTYGPTATWPEGVKHIH